jgi:hypothetical protein
MDTKTNHMIVMKSQIPEQLALNLKTAWCTEAYAE